MSFLIRWIDNRFYPGVGSNWDDSLLHERILPFLTPDSEILDLGTGAGIVSQTNSQGLVCRVCGIDPDPRVMRNAHLDEAQIGMGKVVPYPDAVFDLVFADNAAEHLAKPAEVFREVARVLKPGSPFFIKRPNRHHYVPLIARLTPLCFHRFINHLRGRAWTHFQRFIAPTACGRLRRWRTLADFA